MRRSRRIATIAGVSLVIGLYAARGALLRYAAFGSSQRLVAVDAVSTATSVAPGEHR